jgi:hypothetical protein
MYLYLLENMWRVYTVAYTIIDSPTHLSIVKHSKNYANYKFSAYIKVNNLHNKKLLKNSKNK